VINGVPINGYFIGYVEKYGNIYLFATNIEADDLPCLLFTALR
jgi:beta-lactamase class D